MQTIPLLRKAKVEVGKDGCAPMAPLMLQVYTDSLWRHFSEGRVQASRFVFACLADIICAAIEVSKGTDTWSTFDLCRLPIRQSLKRRRRLSPAFKVSATQVAATAKRLRTVTQLMSAKDVFDKGSLSGEHKGILEYAHAERFNYVLSSLAMFDGCKSFGVNCDASTMGGDDLLAVFMTNADRQIGAWGPPQVPAAHNGLCVEIRGFWWRGRSSFVNFGRACDPRFSTHVWVSANFDTCFRRFFEDISGNSCFFFKSSFFDT